MSYKYFYKTPDHFSDIWLISDGEVLTGLWFADAKDVLNLIDDCEEKNLLIFEETVKWLDIYFQGKEPDFMPKYRVENLTGFRREVIENLIKIPYGEVITYGEIAKNIANARGMKRMSAQAVGQAVGWNPIGILIPCHRVVGADHRLVGYGGGMKNKIALLELERHEYVKNREKIRI